MKRIVISLVTIKDMKYLVVGDVHIKLDNLPDILLKLNCSFNQLTSLENLPNCLNTLCCSNNNITQLMNYIKSGNKKEALQEYCKCSFINYITKKDDEGILFIDINKEPYSTCFIRTIEDLNEAGLRFNAKSAPYIATTSFVDVYPQIKLVPTTKK